MPIHNKWVGADKQYNWNISPQINQPLEKYVIVTASALYDL